MATLTEKAASTVLFGVGVTKAVAPLADLAFWYAMASSLQPQVFVDVINGVGQGIFKAVDEGYPDRWNRNLDKLAKQIAVSWPSTVFQFSMALTLLTMDKRSMFLNMIYLGYGLTTTGYALFDTVLNEDNAEWTVADRMKHILYPVGLKENKLLPRDLSPGQVNNHMKMIVEKEIQSLDGSVPSFVLALVSCVALYAFGAPLWLQNVQLALAFPLFIRYLKTLTDIALLQGFQNLFPAMFFGDNVSAPFQGLYGYQYEYFRNNNIVLQDFLHKRVYSTIHGAGFGIRDARAGMILARGAVVLSVMALFGFMQKQEWIKDENENIFPVYKFSKEGMTDMILVGLYYALHAGFAFVNKTRTKDLKNPLLSGPLILTETLLSTFLFIAPVRRYRGQGLFSPGPDVLYPASYMCTFSSQAYHDEDYFY